LALRLREEALVANNLLSISCSTLLVGLVMMTLELDNQFILITNSRLASFVYSVSKPVTQAHSAWSSLCV